MASRLSEAEAEKAEAGLNSMRNQFRDGQITMLDCASIIEAAKRFGVPYFSAYLRAKELGLLSYQTVGSATRLAIQPESREAGE